MSTTSNKARPSTVSTKSFTRYEPDPPSPPLSRSRASTVQSVPSLKSPKHLGRESEDVFDKRLHEDSEPPSPDLGRSPTLPDRFEELPIELASLADRFVESLSAKVYNEPPSIDRLCELFQEFYVRAASAVAIHISALKSRLSREQNNTPTKAAAVRSKTLQSGLSGQSLAPPERTAGFQQMLTASEVTEKRKQRRLLEHKRILLEEAVEKQVCEKIYDKLWRHKSTLDEVKDEKLRSKTAALSLVGIGLKDLGIEWNADSDKTPEDVQASLIPAREELSKMNDEHYPLGKLRHLTAAHKAIVDTLSSIHPSSSSADEILPTLIFALITSPIEGINIISNLLFIQRFRSATKIDGEAAYCLTNLEAAISFLEDVDLASLRADELPEGPRKRHLDTDDASPDKLEAFPVLAGTALRPSTPTTAAFTSPAVGTVTDVNPSAARLKMSPEKVAAIGTPRHQRTLSDLLQPISNANEAVRSTAEEGLKSISISLDHSFKFLLGKLRERDTDDATAEVILPKTLDEARQLVTRPLTPEEDESALSESSSLHDGQHAALPSNLTKTEDKILSLLGGRKQSARERSVDSVQSNESGKKAASATGKPSSLLDGAGASSQAQKSMQPAPTPPNLHPLDSVKSFSTSLNPMNHIGSALGGALGRFGGRSSASASPPVAPAPSTPSILVEKDKPQSEDTSERRATVSSQRFEGVPLRTPDKAESLVIRATPPIPRFMQIVDANELRIGELQQLLNDYQRLARTLGRLVQVDQPPPASESEDTDTGDEAARSDRG